MQFHPNLIQLEFKISSFTSSNKSCPFAFKSSSLAKARSNSCHSNKGQPGGKKGSLGKSFFLFRKINSMLTSRFRTCETT
ncbi:hypothetical protein SLEP1_g22459 [Rubroshorea leprosula]|uniref:Ribosomal protein L32 n=1 Tax=Rubroshorea leprosula TaxID=152421 RepID=A0AAV5JJS1_9ROSI|nr:hypothetical protein SLEP1_g22459 [Rubroshorea leprosula]